MKIDPANPLPLYAQVEKMLASSISSGEFPVGSQFPTEDELIARCAVSRTTVRKAVENLAHRGLVEIRRGKGTFVAEPRMIQELKELTGFVEDMQALGRNPTARLIGARKIPATKIVAERLALKLGDPVVQIMRVRLADGKPVSFDETYLPREIGEKILTNDLEVHPIFALLEQKYHIPLVEAEYCLGAEVADQNLAKALKIEIGEPLFVIERTSYTSDHRPVDYEKLHYRGDLIRFSTRLTRRPTPIKNR